MALQRRIRAGEIRPRPATPGVEDGTEAVVRAMVEAVSERDLDRRDGLFALDLVRHSGSTPGVRVRSLLDVKASLEDHFASVPDPKITCAKVIAKM